MDENNDKDVIRARRRRLTDRLDALRERANAIELELLDYTRDYFRVCIFGSARIKPDDEIYKTTAQLAFLLAKEGIDVLTGGGPGLMEAANKGAREGKAASGSKSRSFGISIEGTTREMQSNEHIDVKHRHRKFSSRLDDFMRLSNAVVVTPGGIGTLLELYFSWQLLQVKHIAERPIVLLGREFWRGLLEWTEKVQVSRLLISPEDLRFLSTVDTPEEALDVIKKEYTKFVANKSKPELAFPASIESEDNDD